MSSGPLTSEMFGEVVRDHIRGEKEEEEERGEERGPPGPFKGEKGKEGFLYI